VESRLADDLHGIAAEPVVVTGLYGGVDWGPTDAWIQTDQPTVVICTFEKADALLRYLGVLFLSRVPRSSLMKPIWWSRMRPG
jgi:hypothetical protein